MMSSFSVWRAAAFVLAVGSLAEGRPLQGFDIARVPIGGFHLAAAPSTLQLPPPMPAQWPSTDRTVLITGALLADPLVQDALKYVNQVVPAELLNVPPSTYIMDSTVTYNADAVKYCYYPADQCLRTTNTTNYFSDISSCPADYTWGLTFDDGPSVDNVTHKDTTAIMGMLDAMQAKATFFVLGFEMIQNPQVVLDEYNRGHQIGVHTWTHHPLTALSNEQIVAEIKYTEALIYKTIGKVSLFMRPPYGDMDDRVRAIVSALGYTATVWNQDDTAADQVTTTESIATKLVGLATGSWFSGKNGFISLSHDRLPFTSDVVMQIMKYYQQNKATIKYKIAPVGDCVGMQWYRNLPAAAVTTTTTTSSAPSSTAAAVPTAPVQGSFSSDASTLMRAPWTTLVTLAVFMMVSIRN
ncbi:uncharacterized protein BJ171DRAFT_582526 [Polychytrium aggregatum]|uniref:uncharacterized protein n=1 Tax=Polychytrium aggregatum TaxID=110093 RepID=UPI0022FEB725|nr:uncharacterized protein BJ171DRAFT_582526 [Polychytrium aggregatum]KAI9203759.1 hypothetical protein BJ171DRAFT_582526 [Polychytrium aggregatum]